MQHAAQIGPVRLQQRVQLLCSGSGVRPLVHERRALTRCGEFAGQGACDAARVGKDQPAAVGRQARRFVGRPACREQHLSRTWVDRADRSCLEIQFCNSSSQSSRESRG